jgi:hypothetical protein
MDGHASNAGEVYGTTILDSTSPEFFSGYRIMNLLSRLPADVIILLLGAIIRRHYDNKGALMI